MEATFSRIQVGAAAHLLQGTSLSVGEVGAVCGFENNCSFSRAFRERYGLPPSTYRLNAKAFTTDHANPRSRERKAVLAFGT
jgi:AraC family transcriptional regulator